MMNGLGGSWRTLVWLGMLVWSAVNRRLGRRTDPPKSSGVLSADRSGDDSSRIHPQVLDPGSRFRYPMPDIVSDILVASPGRWTFRWAKQQQKASEHLRITAFGTLI